MDATLGHIPRVGPRAVIAALRRTDTILGLLRGRPRRPRIRSSAVTSLHVSPPRALFCSVTASCFAHLRYTTTMRYLRCAAAGISEANRGRCGRGLRVGGGQPPRGWREGPGLEVIRDGCTVPFRKSCWMFCPQANRRLDASTVQCAVSTASQQGAVGRALTISPGEIGGLLGWDDEDAPLFGSSVPAAERSEVGGPRRTAGSCYGQPQRTIGLPKYSCTSPLTAERGGALRAARNYARDRPKPRIIGSRGGGRGMPLAKNAH